MLRQERFANEIYPCGNNIRNNNSIRSIFSPEITGKTTEEYFPGHKDPECTKTAIEQHASICNDLLEETRVKNCINARFLYCNL